MYNHFIINICFCAQRMYKYAKLREKPCIAVKTRKLWNKKTFAIELCNLKVLYLSEFLRNNRYNNYNLQNYKNYKITNVEKQMKKRCPSLIVILQYQVFNQSKRRKHKGNSRLFRKHFTFFPPFLIIYLKPQ